MMENDQNRIVVGVSLRGYPKRGQESPVKNVCPFRSAFKIWDSDGGENGHRA